MGDSIASELAVIKKDLEWQLRDADDLAQDCDMKVKDVLDRLCGVPFVSGEARQDLERERKSLYGQSAYLEGMTAGLLDALKLVKAKLAYFEKYPEEGARNAVPTNN